MKPELSVIIVNYRSTEVLADCLRSLHVATSRSIEVILVDNSAGQQADAVLQASGIKGLYFPQAENIGYTQAANFGARHANGDILCFLNPDMVLGPKSLDRLVDWAEQHARTVAGPRERNEHGQIQTTAFPFVTHRYLWGANTTYKMRWSRALHPMLPWLVPSFSYAHLCRAAKQPQRVPVLSGSCLVMPMSLWFEVGEFAEELTYFGLESEWFERARDVGITAWYVPSAEVFHEHAHSINKSDHGVVQAEATANRKWYAKKKGWLAVAGLGVALWVEEKMRNK